MRLLSVVGLSEDGSSLLLRDGEDTFAADLDDVTAAQRPDAALSDAPPPAPPSPREIQQQVRHGRSPQDIALAGGRSLDAVLRYAGPVLAEREHQAARARASEVDGRAVDELVAEHMARLNEDPTTTEWDCWLTDTARWEVTARAGCQLVRLRWDSAARRVKPLDEAGRQALLLGPVAQDALGAVLRPVSGPTPVAEPAPAPAEPAPPPATRAKTQRKGRSEVPAWDDIATQVSGRAMSDPTRRG